MILVYCRLRRAWSRSAFFARPRRMQIRHGHESLPSVSEQWRRNVAWLAPATAALGLRHLRLGGIAAGASRLDFGFAGFRRGDRLVILLPRNLFLVDQLLVALQIVLGLHVVGFGLLQGSRGRGKLLLSRP